MKIPIIVSLTFLFSVSIANAHLGLEDGWVEHVPVEFEFENKQYEMTFATYHDAISGFEFNENTKTSITTMPFDWNEETVQQLEFVHAEYYIPKNIEIYKDYKIKMFVNDFEFFGVVDRSPADEIVVHFLIQKEKLLEYSKRLPVSTDTMTFAISSGSKIVTESGLSKETDDGGWLIKAGWEPKGKFPLGKETPIKIEFRDPFTKYVIPQITYDYIIEQNGKIISSETEIFSQNGRDSIFVIIDTAGSTKLKIQNINGLNSNVEFEFDVAKILTKDDADHLVVMSTGAWQQGCEKINTCFAPYTIVIKTGETILFENQDKFAHNVLLEGETDYLHSSTDIINPNESFVYKFSEVGRHDYWCTLHPWMKGSVVVKDTADLNIPDWVRNNAAWWANGEIDDNTFASGIQFLIKENIISVPITDGEKESQDRTIPDWVRNNAAWWADGQIDDSSFASGIQFLIKEGIISV